MRRRLMSNGRNERGQAMIEFALVLPILLLVIMACLEFSWYFLVRYDLSKFAGEVGYNVKEPFFLYWPRNWNDSSRGGKPSWLSVKEADQWSFDEYDGWYALNNPGPDEIIGSDYNYTALDNQTLFSERLKTTSLIIRPELADYQVRGGWYIKAEAIDMPKSGGSAWKAVRDRERSEYYFVDVTVDLSYRYQPLTFVGKVFLCPPGQDYMLLKEHGRYTYATRPGWLS